MGLGHKLRDDANVRVRQPLSEVRFTSSDPNEAAAIEHLAEVVKEELNVKRLIPAENLDGLATYSYKPILKTLGPKYGKLLGGIGKALATAEAALLAPFDAERMCLCRSREPMSSSCRECSRFDRAHAGLGHRSRRIAANRARQN